MDELHDKVALLMQCYHDFMCYVENYQSEVMAPKEEPMEEVSDEPLPFDDNSGPMAPMFSERESYSYNGLDAYDPSYSSGVSLGIPMAVLVRFSNSDMLKPEMGDE